MAKSQEDEDIEKIFQKSRMTTEAPIAVSYTHLNAVERGGDQAEQLHHLFQPRQVDDDHIQGQQYADISDDHRHKGDEQPAPDAK